MSASTSSIAQLPTPVAVDTKDSGTSQVGAPHNFEAEQALLGSLFVNNDICDRVSGFLTGAHFYDPLHGRIYDSITRLVGEGQPATPITLRAYFESDEDLAAKGGVDYLPKLATSPATLINAVGYAHAIYDLAMRRALIRTGQDIYDRARDVRHDDPPTRQIEAAEETLYRIAEGGKYEEGFQGFDNSLARAIEMASEARSRDGHLSGLATGLRDLDSKLGGLQNSDLIVIAGRPSMGKTALATTIAFHAAHAWEGEPDESGVVKTKNGARVGFFSLEMSSEQIAMRLLSARARISGDKIRKGRIDEDEFQRLADASHELQTMPLYIDHTGAIPLATLAARARRLKRQKGLDMLIVDYLQLVTIGGKRFSDNRVREVSEITQGLKALAKELNIPVIALSQLSRQVESRDDKRPQLADLRESGAIEQDADAVIFVYREEYYLQREKPRDDAGNMPKWQASMEKVHGLAEAIIGKHRHGPTGDVKLHFDAQFTRFTDLAETTYLPETPETAGEDDFDMDVPD